VKSKYLRVLQRLDKVSRDDVNSYYVKILGRLPESEKPLEVHAGHTDFRSLIKGLLESEEFRLRADQNKVSRNDVNEIFLKILGRLPESETLLEAHLEAADFRKLVKHLLDSEEFRSRVDRVGIDKVSRADINECYVKILGRLPESEETFDAHVGQTQFRSLIEGLVGSEEFRSRVTPKVVQTGRVFHPLAVAHNYVDTNLTAEQLRLCLARVQTQWQSLGETRPHYSVLSSERYEPELLRQNLDLFRESGYLEVEQVIGILKRHGLKESHAAQANELGCGVGRVTVPLACFFGSVTGYDISPPHLRLAREYADEREMRNIMLREVPIGSLPAFQPCDFFYSKIVLQHNPPPVIRYLVRAMLTTLRPGGFALFQVPSYIAGYRFSLDEWLNASAIDDMEMHVLPVRDVLEEASAQDCVALEVCEDDAGSNLIRSQTYLFQKR
jgi:SAM-dependent methyltransferase